jgi:hypothetical protein
MSRPRLLVASTIEPLAIVAGQPVASGDPATWC